MSFAPKFRRRREGKTNYHKRLRLLQSGKPRIVVRRSNTGITVQIINYEPAGDKVLAQASPKDLVSAGLTQTSGKSIPAAYLIGFAAGMRAKKAGVTEAIVDIGLQSATKGNRLFAAVKGAIDAGLAIPVSEEILPSADRVEGKHIAAFRNVTLNIADAKKKLSH